MVFILEKDGRILKVMDKYDRIFRDLMRAAMKYKIFTHKIGAGTQTRYAQKQRKNGD